MIQTEVYTWDCHFEKKNNNQYENDQGQCYFMIKHNSNKVFTSVGSYIIIQTHFTVLTTMLDISFISSRMRDYLTLNLTISPSIINFSKNPFYVFWINLGVALTDWRFSSLNLGIWCLQDKLLSRCYNPKQY